jgi:putative transport protein
MISGIVNFLTQNDEFLIFLSLGIGYFIGSLKFKGISLGATAGTLIVALLLGQMKCVMPDLLKTVSFSLFTFVIGYNVGPQFFGALKKQGLNYILIALVVAITALLTAMGLGKIFHFDAGTTAGILAGALTTSAAIGTSEGALAHVQGLTDSARAAMETNVAVAYAITYIFGTVGGIPDVCHPPRILGFSMKDEARALERSMSGGGRCQSPPPDYFSWSRQLSLRAYW